MNGEHLRDYELSIWTLLDTFINVLKWSGMEYRDENDEFIRKYPGIGLKGLILNGSITLSDDGTEKLDFSVPRFYYVGRDKTLNPLWQYFEDNNFTANMYKIKIIFNKGETDIERVFEFILNAVELVHELDLATYNISCSGLAFEELGKIGYKISLELSDFEEEYQYWFEHSLSDSSLEMPIASLSYWNDKIFKNSEGDWKYLWQYDILMKWDSFNNYLPGRLRDSHKVYEESFITEWKDSSDGLNYVLAAARKEDYREKSRMVDLKESNIYNLTQSLAETFGVYCRYEYEYDENYHIIGKKVIYYNNYLEDTKGVIDLTYPYTMASATRSIDSSEITTKMFVRPVDSTEAADNLITIINVDANKTGEDYLLDFDYLHEIRTITDEQYVYIKEYEALMHFYNRWLNKYNTEITWLQDELVTLEALLTFYINSIALDKELISDLLRARDAYVDDDYNSSAEDGYIPRDETHPVVGTVLTHTINNAKVYSVNLSLEGISRERPIRVYEKKNYSNTKNTFYLEDEVQSFLCETDEYGGVNKLTNIVFKGEKPTTVFITCSYAPVLYYNNAIDKWKIRLAEDERNKAIVDAKINLYKLRLYGADADYAITDFSTVDYYYVGFGRAGQDILEFINNKNSSEAYTRNIEANDGYGRADIAEVEEVSALLAAYDHILDKKNMEITHFERLMGPALREGYWQPDTYDDYGNSELDRVTINYPAASSSYTATSTSSGYIKNTELLNYFIWDLERFEEETDIIYQADITTTENAYLVINLSGHLNAIKDHLNDLSFIYYDKNIVTMINALDKGLLGYEQQVESLKLKLMRSCLIGSGCEFGYVLTNAGQIVPVLIVTDITDLSADLLSYILNPSDQSDQNSSYPPFIGTISTVVSPEEISLEHAQDLYGLNGELLQTHMEQLDYEYDEVLEMFYPNNPHVEIQVNSLISNLSFFNNINESNILALNNISTLGDNSQYHGKFFPRLLVHSLEMKTDEDNFMLSVNGQMLEMYEDYYILSRSNQLDESLNGYYITIKPEALFLFGDTNLSIGMSYNISNADMNIYLDALKIMRENSRPKVSYSVQLNLLNEELILTAYNQLNHIVHINDFELGFNNVLGYISSITLNLDDFSQDTFEIKNYETKFEDLFSTIVALTESMKKNENAVTTAVNAFSQGELKVDVVQNSLFRKDLNYRFNLGKLTINEADGIWAVSDEGVVAMRGGGIFTATKQDEEGNWQWNSGILPSGINANLITAGLLDTNKIKIYAGDKVKFQLNGDGLFAYKSIFDSGEFSLTDEDLTSYTNAYNEYNIDPLLYVTFNDNGLFLVAKKGALMLDPVKNSIVEITNDLNRVEVSWNGLIIRNTSDQKVFYADTAGNLTLKGTIEASDGYIGGWTINTTGLSSNYITLNPAEIKFYNGTTNYLTCTTAGLTITGNITGSSISGGTITGSTVSGGKLTGGAVKTNYLYVGSDYNVNTTTHNVPYMEYNQGNLTVSGGTINGGQVTGSSVKTNYLYVTLNYNIASNNNTSSYMEYSGGNLKLNGAIINATSANSTCNISEGKIDLSTNSTAAALNIKTQSTEQAIMDITCANLKIGNIMAGSGSFSAEETSPDESHFITAGTYSIPTILITTTETTVDVPVSQIIPGDSGGSGGINISDDILGGSFKHPIPSAGIELGGGEVRIIGDLVLEGHTLYIENGRVYAD